MVFVGFMNTILPNPSGGLVCPYRLNLLKKIANLRSIENIVECHMF